ncbi:MAG: radical SAM family heme chaperone HemW [Fimbriimonadaceae bacterium]
MPEPIAVYVHTPFCPSKCGYCDFNSYAMQGEIVERTTRAMIRELETSPWRGTPAKTVFLGGGTPTFLPETLLTELIAAIFDAHPPVPGAEITSEANPGTVDVPKFESMRRSGIERISLGAQSFVDSDLKALDRVHQSGDIERAVRAARRAGFDNINLDLMFALPGQTLDGWRANLDRAIELQPEHLSLYCLTIEPNTRFYKLHHRGAIRLPSDEAQVAMYDLAVSRAEEAGYEPYEISNFAKPGRQCRHNLEYWRCADYLGYGPGAVGCFTVPSAGGSAAGGWERYATVPANPGDRIRYTVVKHPERYAAAAESGQRLAFESESLSPESLRLERIMLGLRLTEGVSMSGLDLDPIAVAELERRGWLWAEGNRIGLTRPGRHFCSEAALALA